MFRKRNKCHRTFVEVKIQKTMRSWPITAQYLDVSGPRKNPKNIVPTCQPDGTISANNHGDAVSLRDGSRDLRGYMRQDLNIMSTIAASRYSLKVFAFLAIWSASALAFASGTQNTAQTDYLSGIWVLQSLSENLDVAEHPHLCRSQYQLQVAADNFITLVIFSKYHW